MQTKLAGLSVLSTIFLSVHDWGTYGCQYSNRARTGLASTSVHMILKHTTVVRARSTRVVDDAIDEHSKASILDDDENSIGFSFPPTT